MSEDVVAELRRLQRYASGLRSLLDDAQSQVPDRAEGADRTGVVRVLLAADGLPREIRVASGWHRRLAADRFADAVAQAGTDALSARLTAWSATLEQQDWQGRAERLRDPGSQPLSGGSGGIPPALRGPAAAGSPSPAHPGRPAPPGAPRRSLGELTEEMIRAFDTTAAATAKPADPKVGTGTSGGLTITVSRTGPVACDADPRWVAEQTAARLTTALGKALAAARADLDRAVADENPAGPLDGLLAEALSMLADPARLTKS
jgi:hypothetical protein